MIGKIPIIELKTAKSETNKFLNKQNRTGKNIRINELNWRIVNILSEEMTNTD